MSLMFMIKARKKQTYMYSSMRYKSSISKSDLSYITMIICTDSNSYADKHLIKQYLSNHKK